MIAPGTKLGPYEIIVAIGAGGMGEVYRAKDTRLDRTVAIKVLRSHLSSNPDLRQRFEREARAVSSLNHPHICTLHDIGHQDGTDFLVMEYIEGETLASRLQKGPLPPAELLRYSIEVAQALDKAHKQGITHRDLKPGNIMLTKSGVKLLDFGLAKMQVAAAGHSVSQLATAGKELTAEGAILGTLQYMAPEQLEGKATDARTDIFAFGTLLYEMITGKKAFEGKNQASLIAAILEKEPMLMSTLQPMTPPALERVVKTCLVKDPDERWQSAHDIAAELRWIAEGGGQQGAAAVPAVPTIRKWNWLIAGAVLGAALAVLLFLIKNVPAKQTAHLSLLPPAGVESVFAVALSPDGKKVALTTSGAGGSLWVRSLDTGTAQQLSRTEEAYPFWSPDGKFIAYETEHQLFKISAAGGPAQVLCSARYPSGGTWNKDGVIVFGSWETPLYKVSATGGNPVQLDTFDASHHETGHLWPSFLPDSRHYLYLGIATLAADYTLRIGSLDSKDSIILFDHIFSPAIYDSGKILFVRDGNLMSQPFDAAKLKLTGEAVPVAAHLAWHDRHYYPFSANGAMLVFLQHDSTGRLKWFDRTGKMLGEVGSPADDVGAELSPDDQTVAFERLDVNRRNPEIWLLDLQRGAESQFTINPMGDVFPVWSPDGKTIAYGSLVDGKVGIYRAPAIGGARELILQSEGDPQSWGQPGISLEINNEKLGSADIAVLPLSGDHKLIPIAETAAWEWRSQFSLDGHWIAYNSGSEVFVQPFPPTGARWQVSSNGGGEVRWRADGRELYFVGNDRRQLMAVEVQTENSFRAGIPKPLFTADFRDFQNRFSYDVTRDGQRFLVNTEEPETAVLSVIVNWLDSL